MVNTLSVVKPILSHRVKNGHNKNGVNSRKKMRRVASVLNTLCMDSILDLQIKELTERQNEICENIGSMIRNISDTQD